MPRPNSAVIIIPTIGRPELAHCVKSCLGQTFQNTQCLVVVDGPAFSDKTDYVLRGLEGYKKLVLPWPTGAHGWAGRIRAGVSLMCTHDVLFYCDDDNWFDPDHVETCMKKLSEGLDWCFSLRRIADKDGRILGEDDCESLGLWPTWNNSAQYFVDTNCYCVSRTVAQKVSGAWMHQGWGEDRAFFAAISTHFPKYGCTGKSTVTYRLGGNPNSVKWDFFARGNALMAQRYPNGLPWRNAHHEAQEAQETQLYCFTA